MLDKIFNQTVDFKKKLQDLLSSGIVNGAVRPLTYCTFEKDEVEAAFRYMAAGKHIGKVIIKIREEEHTKRPVKPTLLPINAIPRYTCHEDHVYVLVGGLGGFGLELADWLIMRGARKLILNSRKGVVNGYQTYRLRAWASYGADVQISTHDVTTETGCEDMLKMAKSMGHVDAIFNLAVVLKDLIFQNQTPETFQMTYGPKALVTMNLDKYSKMLCPSLRNFVIFSSVSCGRGNPGLTNYALSNSVMERICEWRHKLGLPALAIQWGPIGDVGVLADMHEDDIQIEIGGTLQQGISSCLASLDTFLKQDAVIVSSIVVAVKKAGDSSRASILDAIAKIMVIKDLKTVSQQMSLAELGMDSIMAVEIKQTLEREFEIFLTAQDIRTLTFTRLSELTAESASTASKPATQLETSESAAYRILIRNLGDERILSEPFLCLPTLVTDGSEGDEVESDMENIMFMIPGAEGSAAAMASLCRRLKIRVCVLQPGIEHPDEDLEQMTERFYEIVRARLARGAAYKLLGYSFGAIPILALAAKLESKGHKGTVFCIDGSPEFVYRMLSKTINAKNEKLLQNSLLYHIMDIVAPNSDISKTIKEKLNKIETFSDRIDNVIQVCLTHTKYSNKFIKYTIISVHNRVNIVINDNTTDITKLKSPIVLLRSKDSPIFGAIDDNYGLDKYTESNVTVHFIDSNHINIVDNKDCANIINRLLIDGNTKGDKTAHKVVNFVENKRGLDV